MSARRQTRAAAAANELKEAQAVLVRFTKQGRASAKEEPTDFSDPMAVTVLKLRGRITADPRESSDVGAWVTRARQRGFGHCAPLAEGMSGVHVLVLDSQALDELRAAENSHAESLVDYRRLQRDLEHLRELGEDS